MAPNNDQSPSKESCRCGEGDYRRPISTDLLLPSSNICTNNNADNDQDAEKVRSAVKARMETLKKSCRALEDSSFEEVATVSGKEIKVGYVIGSGGSSIVCEIDGFHDTSSNNKSNKKKIKNKLDSRNDQEPQLYTLSQQEARKKLFENAMIDEGLGWKTAAFAVKVLRRTEQHTGYISGVCDLATEAQMMVAFNHPNILKLKGYCEASNFLIVDRLSDTLREYIYIWREELAECKKKINSRNCWRLLFQRRNQRVQERKIKYLLAERLDVARCVASALAEMHNHNVMHRDITTANIGFDLEGRVKVFDLGLACVLPDDHSTSRLYKVGTPTYMAPEVQRDEPYNEKADVYSFGVVLCEILSLASAGMTQEKCSDGEDWVRCCSCWPFRVQQLVRDCLANDMAQRPNMEQVECILREEILKLLSFNKKNSKTRTIATVPEVKEHIESMDETVQSFGSDSGTNLTHES